MYENRWLKNLRMNENLKLNMKNLPIGIQEFSEIITNDCYYIDKTNLLYQLINAGKTYFLSRPRRFGKSMTVSTFKEIFEGNKSLFQNTWIYDQWDWNTKYPVIRIDFSKISHKEIGLMNALVRELSTIANFFNITLQCKEPGTMFNELINLLTNKNKVVILIDEYDKPIIDYIDDIKNSDKNREILKNFYSVLKGNDANIKFLFLTGVSKFAKTSIFSDLNHLRDITFNTEFSCLCGYTQEDLESVFEDRIIDVCNHLNIEKSDCLAQIKHWYNGYSWDGKHKVYNPFGTLNFFANKEFRDYWFQTATPTFLVKLIRKNNYLPTDIENKVVRFSIFEKYELSRINILSMLLETGYLTIKEKVNSQEVRLDFPNYEVQSAFNTHLLEEFNNTDNNLNESVLFDLKQALVDCKMNVFHELLSILFANVVYDEKGRRSEDFYHSIFFLIVKMIGFTIESQIHTNLGRIDATIKTEKYIYILEFKVGTSQNALKQIKENNYHEKYKADKKEIVLMGIGFDNKKNNVRKPVVEKLWME